MITPFIGQQIWYYAKGGRPPAVKPQAAIITNVISTTLVNLAVFLDGSKFITSAAGVQLVQKEQTPPPAPTPYCTWLPYQ